MHVPHALSMHHHTRNFNRSANDTASLTCIILVGGPNLTEIEVDYENTAVMVTFAAGQTVSSPVSISIKGDQIREPSEQFRATYELPSGFKNLQKGNPSEAIITIQELESKSKDPQGSSCYRMCIHIYRIAMLDHLTAYPGPIKWTV